MGENPDGKCGACKDYAIYSVLTTYDQCPYCLIISEIKKYQGKMDAIKVKRDQVDLEAKKYRISAKGRKILDKTVA